MLKTLRNKTSGFVAKALLGLVVVAFVVGGFASFFQGAPSNTVLTAGRTNLDIQDYLLAFRQAEASLAQRIQRRPTREEAIGSGIEAQVMSQLVSEAVLDEQARRLDLGLSEDRLAKLIADDPSFKDAAGNFSRAQFRQLLSNVEMNEADFIRNREGAAVRSQIVDAVAGGAVVPATLRTAFGLYSNERRTVDYLVLPASAVEPVDAPAPDALQAFFDKNKARYAAPEYRTVSYVLMTPDALANPAAVTDEDIRKDYEAGRQRYTVPETRRVQQLVFPDAKAAAAAKVALAGGRSFDDLVRDSGRSPADVDLGPRAKADIPDAKIADAVFALQPNAVSDVVEGTFGPVLLRVADITPESVKPLDAVREEIRRELALAAAGDALQSAYDAFEDARGGGSTLTEAAARAGLAVKTVPAVSRGGLAPDDKPVADLPADPRFLDGVFTAETGAENPPINLEPSGSLFYEVDKIDPTRERTLDEVRPRVLADWTAEETQRLLGERADALKGRIEKGETLDAVAASAGLQKQSAPSITRDSGIATLGRDGVDAAFGAPQGLVATARGVDGASRLVLTVPTVAPPADPAGTVSAADAGRLDQLLQSDLLQAYVNDLRQVFAVVSYPAAVERAQSLVR